MRAAIHDLTQLFVVTRNEATIYDTCDVITVNRIQEKRKYILSSSSV